MKKFSILLFAALLVFAACKKDNEGDSASATPPPTVSTVTENITVNTTWTTGSVYIIEGTLYIDNATLTIQPGTIVKFKDGAQIDIGYNESGSALIANGTAAAPILFTSYASTPKSGDWDALFFENGTASTSSLKFCKFEYGGGYSSSFGTINLNDCSISMDNCIVTNCKNYGITVDSDAEFDSFTNNVVNNTTSHLIKMYPNSVHTIGAGNVFTSVNSSLGILVKGGTYKNVNDTWLAQTVPYIIDGTLYVESNAGSILNIQEGTTIAFTSGSQINVGYSSNTYGTIKAIGTSAKPIIFTSSVISKTPGDWDAIFLENGTSIDTKFEYCKFEYGGGYSSSFGMVNLDDCKATFNNCTFSNNANYGIFADEGSSFVSFEGNTFEASANFPVRVYGNYAHTIGTNNTYNTTLGILVEGDTYDQSTGTWKKQSCGYYINGTLYIEATSGSELIIEAGNKIYFTAGSQINVGYSSSKYGKLVAQGTTTDRIIFSSSAPIGNASAGDWDLIWFDEGTSAGSILDNCDLAYGGGYSSSRGMVDIQDNNTNVTISNCNFSYSESHGISVDISTSTPTLINNTFSNISGEDVHEY